MRIDYGGIRGRYGIPGIAQMDDESEIPFAGSRLGADKYSSSVGGKPSLALAYHARSIH